MSCNQNCYQGRQCTCRRDPYHWTRAEIAAAAAAWIVTVVVGVALLVRLVV